MRYRVFYDYIGGGRNHVHDWLHEQPVKVRARATNLIVNLEAIARPSSKQMKPLKREAAGLIELLFSCHKHYRIFGVERLADGIVILLTGAWKEQGTGLQPPTAINDALKMKQQIEDDYAKYDRTLIVPHNFD